ncbi:MAG: hypothetical protein HY070_13145, partial [Chloroflexi bacterium]|nr:hypothetical protein [Chloroflexota bacterium]
PFVADMNNPLLVFILGLVAIVLAIFRARRAMWFGAGWIAVSLIPATLVANVAPRIAYTPSAGLPIALAAILVQPVARIGKFSRRVGIALVLFLFGAYTWGLSAQVDDWTAVGAVARAVVEETQRLHPTLANDARLYYAGVPDILRGIYIYNDNFDGAIRLAYRAPNLRAARVEKFPIRTDALDRTYFLEYARRKISERSDLVRALETRQRCLGNPLPGIVWDFSQDAQGWQAWNQLSDFQFGNRALTTRALDTDPFMGSPPIDFPAQQLGTIEIEMRVRTDANARGALYWLTAGQIDFSPLQTREFALQTDNAFHRYAVDLAESGQLAFGDRITRLRLDPTDGVGEIEIKSIRVNKWCAENGIGNCLCPP